MLSTWTILNDIVCQVINNFKSVLFSLLFSYILKNVWQNFWITNSPVTAVIMEYNACSNDIATNFWFGLQTTRIFTVKTSPSWFDHPICSFYNTSTPFQGLIEQKRQLLVVPAPYRLELFVSLLWNADSRISTSLQYSSDPRSSSVLEVCWSKRSSWPASQFEPSSQC